MSLAGYLAVATAAGLTRRDAMLLEIAMVYEIARIRFESKGKKEGR